MLSGLLIASCFCDNDKGGDPLSPAGTKKAYGIFKVSMNPLDAKSSLLGSPYDGPTPIVGWETVLTSGECKLLKPKLFSCQNCLGGSICVADNDCRPEPDTMTVGTVNVQGLKTKDGANSFSIDPINGNYQPANNQIKLAYPACTEGETVTISSAGTPLCAAFSVSAKGISIINVLNDSLPMNPGEDIDLKWTAPASPAATTILVVIDISYHGGTKAKIECEAADDGELVIPAALLDSLKTFGMAGHPKLEIYRRSLGSDPGTGVQVLIESMTTCWLKIPGLISCSDVSQCPQGQDCVAQRCQ